MVRTSVSDVIDRKNGDAREMDLLNWIKSAEDAEVEGLTNLYFDSLKLHDTSSLKLEFVHQVLTKTRVHYNYFTTEAWETIYNDVFDFKKRLGIRESEAEALELFVCSKKKRFNFFLKEHEEFTLQVLVTVGILEKLPKVTLNQKSLNFLCQILNLDSSFHAADFHIQSLKTPLENLFYQFLMDLISVLKNSNEEILDTAVVKSLFHYLIPSVHENLRLQASELFFHVSSFPKFGEKMLKEKGRTRYLVDELIQYPKAPENWNIYSGLLHSLFHENEFGQFLLNENFLLCIRGWIFTSKQTLQVFAKIHASSYYVFRGDEVFLEASFLDEFFKNLFQVWKDEDLYFGIRILFSLVSLSSRRGVLLERLDTGEAPEFFRRILDRPTDEVVHWTFSLLLYYLDHFEVEKFTTLVDFLKIDELLSKLGKNRSFLCSFHFLLDFVSRHESMNSFVSNFFGETTKEENLLPRKLTNLSFNEANENLLSAFKISAQKCIRLVEDFLRLHGGPWEYVFFVNDESVKFLLLRTAIEKGEKLNVELFLGLSRESRGRNFGFLLEYAKTLDEIDDRAFQLLDLPRELENSTTHQAESYLRLLLHNPAKARRYLHSDILVKLILRAGDLIDDEAFYLLDLCVRREMQDPDFETRYYSSFQSKNFTYLVRRLLKSGDYPLPLIMLLKVAFLDCVHQLKPAEMLKVRDILEDNLKRYPQVCRELLRDETFTRIDEDARLEKVAHELDLEIARLELFNIHEVLPRMSPRRLNRSRLRLNHSAGEFEFPGKSVGFPGKMDLIEAASYKFSEEKTVQVFEEEKTEAEISITEELQTESEKEPPKTEEEIRDKKSPRQEFVIDRFLGNEKSPRQEFVIDRFLGNEKFYDDEDEILTRRYLGVEKFYDDEYDDEDDDDDDDGQVLINKYEDENLEDEGLSFTESQLPDGIQGFLHLLVLPPQEENRNLLAFQSSFQNCLAEVEKTGIEEETFAHLVTTLLSIHEVDHGLTDPELDQCLRFLFKNLA